METERTRRERLTYGRCALCGEHKANLAAPACPAARCQRAYAALAPREQERLLDAASHVTQRR